MCRRISIAIVLTCALLAGACTDGGGVTSPSPVPNLPDMSVDPTKGDVQVKSAVSDHPSNSVLHDGDLWRIDVTMYCKNGLYQGVVFVREDGAQQVQTYQYSLCSDRAERFIIVPFTGKISAIDPPTLDFSRGHLISIKLASALTGDDWKASRVKIEADLNITWRIE